jgi:hypothetical protein
MDSRGNRTTPTSRIYHKGSFSTNSKEYEYARTAIEILLAESAERSGQRLERQTDELVKQTDRLVSETITLRRFTRWVLILTGVLVLLTVVLIVIAFRESAEAKKDVKSGFENHLTVL